jgi:dipeptidyl aminopeptidase/acylaminoacyl peptidase
VIVCKICGFDNEPGAQFCGSCGGFLEWTGESTAADPAAAPPTTPQTPPPAPAGPQPVVSPDTATAAYPTIAQPVDPNQVICPSCGFANEPDRVFCRRCANELIPIPREPVGPAEVSTRRGPVPAGVAIVGGAVAFVLLLGVALFATGILGRNNGDPTASPSTATVGPSAPASASIEPSAGATASPVITPPPGPTGEIAFASTVDGNADIVVAQADGSSISRLIEAPGRDVQPAWSPDGTQIAWAADKGIRIAKSDGTAGVQFTNHGSQDGKPEWSPDGKIILFTSSRDGDYDLYTRPVGTENNLTPLTKTNGTDHDPSWSAAQNRIAFVSARKGTTDIWTMRTNGSRPTQLTGTSGPKAKEEDPAWSPDGTKIAFASDRDGTFFIYVMNADGSDPQRLAKSGDAVEHDPAWSPDGRFIAFARAGKIVIVSAEGETAGDEFSTLGEENGAAGFPAWH